MHNNSHFRTSSGAYDLEAACLAAGQDLLVLVTGGEKPHIGAVAAATPRPSLADPAKTSATASVLAYVGHKEDAIAKMMSEALGARLGVRVVVAAGMHWEGIGAEGIAAVRQNALALVEMIGRARGQ